MVWRALNNPEADWRLDDDKENGIITNKGMWIINNGERTFVDAWLSRQWVFWVLTSREHNPPMAYIRVSDQIINPCTRKWNLELIRTEVTSQEMEVISQIPLPLSRTNNKLIWPHILRSRNGQASVKSAYHYLKISHWRMGTTETITCDDAKTINYGKWRPYPKWVRLCENSALKR